MRRSTRTSILIGVHTSSSHDQTISSKIVSKLLAARLPSLAGHLPLRHSSTMSGPISAGFVRASSSWNSLVAIRTFTRQTILGARRPSWGSAGCTLLLLPMQPPMMPNCFSIESALMWRKLAAICRGAK